MLYIRAGLINPRIGRCPKSTLEPQGKASQGCLRNFGQNSAIKKDCRGCLRSGPKPLLLDAYCNRCLCRRTEAWSPRYLRVLAALAPASGSKAYSPGQRRRLTHARQVVGRGKSREYSRPNCGRLPYPPQEGISLKSGTSSAQVSIASRPSRRHDRSEQRCGAVAHGGDDHL